MFLFPFEKYTLWMTAEHISMGFYCWDKVINLLSSVVPSHPHPLRTRLPLPCSFIKLQDFGSSVSSYS